MSKSLGLVGWRGMVGQVLVERMKKEGDFKRFKTHLFSTSQASQKAPDFADHATLLDAHDLAALSEMEVVVSCQGGDYTKKVYNDLRSGGWQGYWIDAASALRMENDSCLILDPVNKPVIENALNDGVKTFVGANCTVSLLLMGLSGLFNEDLVQWISTMSYQAISGSGAKAVEEFARQVHEVDIQMNEKSAMEIINHSSFTMTQDVIGAKLMGGLIPWIDTEVEGGQTREEWKAAVEASKILGRDIAIDGTCVRVGSLRSHAQALTLKLKKDIDLKTIESLIGGAHEWVELVENNPEATKAKLNPHYTSGTLNVAVGRVRMLKIGNENLLNLFTLGDQLLWGAAEPLRRMLSLI
jgi:aspartate-semialdehyde dehydrogenase